MLRLLRLLRTLLLTLFRRCRIDPATLDSDPDTPLDDFLFFLRGGLTGTPEASEKNRESPS